MQSAKGWSKSWTYMKEHGLEYVMQHTSEAITEMWDAGTLSEANWPLGVSEVPVTMTSGDGQSEQVVYLASCVAYQHPVGALEARNAWAIVRKRA
jgi:hypothetical protein